MSTIRLGLILLAASLPSASHPAQAQQPAVTGWRLVYAADSLGARTHGEKSHLLAAIRAGFPIRIGWGVAWNLPDGTEGGVEHVAEASFLTIHHGEVFAQIRPILGQAPAARESDIRLRTEGSRLWYALLDTTGRLQGYFTGDSTARTTRAATFWYAPGTAAGAPARLY